METKLLLSYILALGILFYGIFHYRIKAFFLKNQKFNCIRCGQCCRLLVRLSENDTKILESKGLKNFIETKNKVKYIKRINNYCPFLTLKKGKTNCSIYEYRPEICKKFPEIKILNKKSKDARCNAFTLPKILRIF